MDTGAVTVRAVVFDVYGTLVEDLPVGDPASLETAWAHLWQESFPSAPPYSRAAFLEACECAIAREHEALRRRGIPYPEVLWPDVAGAALPAAVAPSSPALHRFLAECRGLGHTVRMARGAGEVLETLRCRGISLGIASNAQAYTPPELAKALAEQGLTLDLFQPGLCFWSFEHGFSKPDPHVFQLLTTRLRLRGVAPGEILMVGDRVENDVQPAQAFGWQTWHLQPKAGHDWPALHAWLCRRLESTSAP